jgi:hypothetical protein
MKHSFLIFWAIIIRSEHVSGYETVSSITSKPQCLMHEQSSIPYWRPFWFDRGNEIFQYRPISVYRFEFTAIYIYIYYINY